MCVTWKQKTQLLTFNEPIVAVSGMLMKSSGTLKDFILSFTGK